MKLLIIGSFIGAALYGWFVPSTAASVQESNRTWCQSLQQDYRTTNKALPDTHTVGYCAKLGISILH